MLESILPVFLVISLGVAIRHYSWLPAEFFPSIEKFSYNIAFPALLFAGTAKLGFHSGQVAELAVATLLPTFLVVGITILMLLLPTGLPDTSRSSVVQGAMRPNSYFGIAVSSLFFEPKAASLVMLAMALCLPFVNVIAVIVLSWWGGGKPNFQSVLKALISNPIILATFAGILASLSGLTLPGPVMGALDILGKSALAMGLLCVGGGLVFSLQGLRPVALGYTSLTKLVALPLVAAKICLIFSISTPVALAGCFYCALPTAPNAYILAKQMGGDSRLMASLITVQTLLAAITIPISKLFLTWMA